MNQETWFVMHKGFSVIVVPADYMEQMKRDSYMVQAKTNTENKAHWIAKELGDKKDKGLF